MRIDLATLAFGYKVESGGNTPNWGTCLGQNREYKINENAEIDKLLRGMVYKSVPNEKVKMRLGRGGEFVAGNEADSRFVLASVFSKVYVNETLIENNKLGLVIIKERSESHNGRLTLKYSDSITYIDGDETYTNKTFYKQVPLQLGLAEDACWFVKDITIRNQDELLLNAVIVDGTGMVTYADRTALRDAWLPYYAYDNNENAFKEWFKQQTYAEGKPYTESTQAKYIGALKNASSKLKSKLMPYESIFNVNDIVELERIADIIRNDEHSAELMAYGSNSLMPCIELYRKFLESKDVIQPVLIYNTNVTSEYPLNRIIFGAPGTGKSYQLEQEKKKLLVDGSYFERVTFHPDYTYANFVGCYKPVMVRKKIDVFSGSNKEVITVLTDETKTAQEKYDLLYDKFKDEASLTRLPLLLGLYTDEAFKTRKQDGSDAVNDNGVERNHGKALRPYVALLPNAGVREEIAYKYVPGPFMRVLVSALKNPQQPHLLLIEEINRANVAAVFGDVFQLLDRNTNGVSEYEIHTSEDMRKYLVEELNVNEEDVRSIKLPNNLFVWATMNSADQGVYPMDTAFKRRWDFEYIGIDDGEDKMKDFEFNVQNKVMKWNDLRVAINNALTNAGINEDKLLGPFFIDKNILDAKDNDKFIKAFCNKVIMYLFEDAARTKRKDIFAQGENKLTYSKLCADFKTKGIDIFVDDIKKAVNVTEKQDDNVNS